MIPEWNQPSVSKKLPVGLYDILKTVMDYVDNASDVEIDSCSIEQELQDIEDKIEKLAIRIEDGEFRKEEE